MSWLNIQYIVLFFELFVSEMSGIVGYFTLKVKLWGTPGSKNLLYVKFQQLFNHSINFRS